MNEDGKAAPLRLIYAFLVVFGWMAFGIAFVVWGYYVLPVLAIVGIVVLFYRWLKAGFKD